MTLAMWHVSGIFARDLLTPIKARRQPLDTDLKLRY
jgi:hypothetical protein